MADLSMEHEDILGLEKFRWRRSLPGIPVAAREERHSRTVHAQTRKGDLGALCRWAAKSQAVRGKPDPGQFERRMICLGAW